MRYCLDPALPVLLRPDGAVQVGWNPRRAVLVRPPDGLSPTALAGVLRAMAVPMRRSSRANAAGAPAGVDLVVLADGPVAS